MNYFLTRGGRRYGHALFLGVILSLAFHTTGQAEAMKLEAKAGQLNTSRVEIMMQNSFPNQQSVTLKVDVAPSAMDNTAPPTSEPDLILPVRAPKPGRYIVSTYATINETGIERLKTAKSKFESLFLWFQIDKQRPTRRVVFEPWGKPAKIEKEHTGVFEFTGEEQQIRLWLPAGVNLHRLELTPYIAPLVPPEAGAYQPTIVPPAEHPRLWVTKDSLAKVRANLTHPENRPYWESVSAQAAKPFEFHPTGDAEVPFNTPLEHAAMAKAFFYLMQGDQKIGREAADLMLAYLPRVEFGNLLDITRQIGAAIYTGACVYDWCYDLLSPAERDTLRHHFLRLAEQMECGWPPFLQTIVNGHGNEAQINRDLLAMAIAIYNEDPLPYKYCAYPLLEQLVPMRRFEYQSPRHNQGISYGDFRFGWEMHAAWLLRRMSGHEVFDSNIKRVPLYWLYFRLPDGSMLRDGDGVKSAGKYWKYARTALLCSAYNGDPIMKGELQRQGGFMADPALFLLLNDPAITPELSLDSLPLTMDFGPILGGMVARTGWTLGETSPDVIAAIRGGGYHFGNHQHSDAGAIQIYYHGMQVGPLAQYRFYGTPYDLNFGKRSVAQSMMLVFDPNEAIPNNQANDGGSRYNPQIALTPKEAMSDPRFHYGKVQSSSFGPDAKEPDFSYFAADLRQAYSDKVTAYVRQFCFLNLHLPKHPAAIILLDSITSKNPTFRKVWQLTTVQDVQPTSTGVRLGAQGKQSPSLNMRMLLPAAKDRTLDILSGEDVFRVDGKVYQPPDANAPEAHGHRILVSPKTAQSHDIFLSVLQPGKGKPLPVAYDKGNGFVTVRIANRLVVMVTDTTLRDQPLEFTVPASKKQYKVWVAGLTPGNWNITNLDDKDASRQVKVEAEKHTLTFTTHGGRYQIAP